MAAEAEAAREARAKVCYFVFKVLMYVLIGLSITLGHRRRGRAKSLTRAPGGLRGHRGILFRPAAEIPSGILDC